MRAPLRPIAAVLFSSAILCIAVAAGCGRSARDRAAPAPRPASQPGGAAAPGHEHGHVGAEPPAAAAEAASARNARPAAAPVVTVPVTMKDFSYTPDKITVPVGARVRLLFRNEGQKRHDFKVESGLGEPRIESIGSGGAATLEFIASTPGEYVFYCTLRGHRDRGMRGLLTVR